MTQNPVVLNLLENGDYILKLNHAALNDVLVSLSRVIEEERGGVARSLFTASALYCMSGTINYMLRERNVPVKEVTGTASLKMGKNTKNQDLVESMTLNINVDIPEEYKPELDSCIKYLEDGCLITRGLKKGIKVTNNIQIKKE
jgi:organic hydroperoxide reductase OsmC/OhrA